jgi:hypothetical protein
MTLETGPAKFWTTSSGFLVHPISWYFWSCGTSGTSENKGFTFWEFYRLKRCVEGVNEFLSLGCTFLDDLWDEIPLQ